MLNLIKDQLKLGKKIYYVVPEQFTLSTEIEIFNYLNLNSTIDLKVKSFRSIINEILSVCGGARYDFLSDASAKLILKLSIAKVKEELRVYHKSINEDGFIGLIMNFIKTLKSNIISPSMLKERIENIDYNDTLKEKLKDIYLIYNEYQSVVEKSSYDSQDRMDLATEKIKYMDSFKDTIFYFDQFSSMSKQEIVIMEELEKLNSQIYFSLTMDDRLIDQISKQAIYEAEVEDGAIFEVSRKLLRSLYQLDLEFIRLQDDSHDNEGIDKLLRSVFSYKIPAKLTSDEAIKNVFIDRFKNTKEECESLVININKDIYLNKLRYKDIAVVVADQEEYYDQLKRQLKLNNIPFFMDAHRNLLENPIAKYIKSAITLLGSSFSYEDIITYLKHAFYEIDQDSINIFQNYIKQRKIIGNMIFDDKYFVFSPKDNDDKNRYLEEDKHNFEVAKYVRDIFVDSLHEFGNNHHEILDRRSKTDSIRNFCKNIYDFISSNKAMARIIAFETKLESENRNDIIEENRLVWNRFVEILDDFANVDMDILISYQEFSKYIQESIDEIKIGIVPPSQDQLLIGNLERSRFMHVKKIYMLGLSNKFFPKAHQEADIFIEDEKEELIESGIDIDNTHKSYTNKDIYALYNAFSKAHEEIHVSFSLINKSNEAMQQASIVNYIVPVIQQSNVNYDDANFKDNLYSKSRLSYYLPTTYGKIRENDVTVSDEEKNFVYSLYKKLKNLEDYKSIVASIDKYGNFIESKSHLDETSYKDIYSDSMKLSISQIESYNECPYKHFVSYGLRPREEGDFNMDSLSFGNITHKTVDNFVKHLAYTDYLDESQVLAAIDDNFKENVQEYMLEYQLEDSRNNYYIRRLRDMLGVSCFVLNKQLQIMHPDKIYTEARYGSKSIFPAVEYEVDGKNYSMAGVIDRVDEYNISGDIYRKVIDYKTGNKNFNLLNVYYGLDIQLMIYLYTVSKTSGASPIGAFYEKLNHKYNKIDNESLQESELLKKHILDGLVINDLNVLKRLDSNFIESGSSNSVLLKSKGRKHSYLEKTNFIDDKTFDKVFDHVNTNVKESIHEIINGRIEAKPYLKKGNTPCQYCSYQAICKFKKDNYNILEIKSEEEILKLLGGQNG